VKMIFIDPPYNTGNDFIYPDDYSESLETYLRYTGQVDNEGRKFSTNTDTDGRFHSKWLNMMYPRLFLARNLLSKDGVVMISIGDQEVDNLRKLCNEIFGEDSFVATAVWEKKNKGAFLAKDITNMKDYVMIYCHDKTSFCGLIGQIVEDEETYPCVNAPNAREIRKIPAGITSKYREKNYLLPKGNTISVGTMNLVLHSDLVIEDGVLAKELEIEGNWRYRQELMTEYAKKGDLYITQDLYLRRIVREPREKTLRDLLPRLGTSGQAAKNRINQNDLFEDGWGTNEDANEELRILLGEQNLLDYPKPVRLISKLICSIRDKNALICDFFAGSGTTAQAVLEQNNADDGKRRFILVQLPEQTQHQSFPTIAEITKERVRRVIKTLNESDGSRLDLANTPKQDRGFKVFKLQSSNFKAWNAEQPKDDAELAKQLTLHVDHLVAGRSQEDVLYELLLKSGFPLDTPIEKVKLANKTVFSIADGMMLVCLEKELTLEVLKAMADKKPERVVCLDAGFANNDQLKTNAVQTMKAKGVTKFQTV